MFLKFSTKENKGIKIEIDGVEYQLRKTNFGDQRIFARIKKMDELECFEEILSFLESLGIPKNISELLPIDFIKPLFEEIFKDEKKS